MQERTQKVLDSILIFSLLVFALAIGCQQLMDLDTFWHLASGRWMTENGFFPPAKDPFSYTSSGTASGEGRAWIDLHWGFQHLLFWVFGLGGINGLVLLGMGLILLLAVWPLLFFGAHTRLAFIAGLSCIAFLAAANRTVLRPELLSFNFGMLMVCCLLAYDRSQNRLFLLALPFLQLLWTNSQGIFVIGPAIVGVFAFGAFLHDRKRFSPYFLATMTTTAVCLVNPYGLTGFLFPGILWQRISQKDGSIYASQIGEFLPPFMRMGVAEFSDILFFKVWLVLGAGLFILAIFRRTFHWGRFFIFLILAFLAFKARRNVALFTLLTLPILCAELAPLWRDKVLLFSKPKQKRFLRPFLTIGVLIFIAYQTVQLTTDALSIAEMNLRRSGFGIRQGIHPIGPAQLLASHNIQGRIFSDMGQFGFLLWHLPKAQFAFDNRLEVYKEGELFEHLFLLTGAFASRNPGDASSLWQAAWDDFVKRHPTDVVVLAQEPSGPPAMFHRLLEHPAQWALVYFGIDGMVFAGRENPNHQALIKTHEIAFNDAAIAKAFAGVDSDLKMQDEFFSNVANRVWYALLPDPIFYPERALMHGRLAHSLSFPHVANPYYAWAYAKNPELADTLLAQSIVWQQEAAQGDLERFDLAVAKMEAGIKRFPDNPQMPYRLGRLFYRHAQNEGLKSPDAAVKWVKHALSRYDAALAIDPGFFPAIGAKVEILEKLNQKDAAEKLLATVYNENILEPELLYKLSTVQMKNQDYAAAVKTLRRLNHLYHHQDPKIWFRLALCHARLGNTKEAKVAFLNARQKNRLFIAGKEHVFNEALAPQIPKLHEELISLNIRP